MVDDQHRDIWWRRIPRCARMQRLRLCSRSAAPVRALGPVLAAATLLASVPAAVASPRAPRFSLTPSTTQPYAVCGRPTTGHFQCLAVLVPARSSSSKSRSAQPNLAPGAARLQGSGVGGGYAPADLRSAYGLPSASAGSGQTVAIVDAFDDPNAESDLAKYRSRYGIEACTTANGCFRKVNQTGGTTYPTANAGWAVEISLDLDMVSTACPLCHVLLVEASSNSDANLFAAENEAAALGATEISNSWGGAEFSNESSFDSDFHHPGVPITVSAGDFGFEVEYPAASPEVVSVGGTTLTPASNARGWSETAWSESGGGCSVYEAKPTWQTDGGCGDRTDNDVAAVANPETPVSVADSYKLPKEFPVPEPGWTLVGGTSASSPLVAGMIALSNAYTRSFPGADAFYTEIAQHNTGAFTDVVSGSTGECGTYLCNAGPGYDGPTGWGSPYGAPEVAKTIHYYKNRVRLAENVKVPVIAWGNLELTAEGVPTTECENVVGGYIENPKGGGAGVGATESFNAFNCKNSTCLAPDFESVQARNLNGEHETSTEGPFGSGNQVKWPSVLEEKATGTIRTNSSNVSVLVGCRESAGHLVTGAFVECFTESGVDEQTPKDENGTGIGSAPSTNEFDEGSGALNCSGAFKGETGKKLKVMGYNEQELISAE